MTPAELSAFDIAFVASLTALFKLAGLFVIVFAAMNGYELLKAWWPRRDA